MKFSIVIYAAPYSSEAANSAFNFCKSLLEQGHEIYRLFFYGDGVHNASTNSVVAQDEKNLQKQWHELIQQHKLDSVVCVSSAIKRGILNQQETSRHELNQVTMYDSSEISGLGQFVDATIHSDRVINFG